MKIFQKILPHSIAVLIFLALTLAYVSPILQGKKIFQGDMTNFKGMSKEMKDFREQNEEEALWAGNMFSGMPGFQISVNYKDPIRFINKILTLGLPNPADKIFLYFIGFYILLMTFKFEPKLAVLGAIGFALSSYFFILLEAGHNTKAHALGYMAPVVAGALLTYRGKYLLGGTLVALFGALQIGANHYQMTYYLLIMMLLFGIIEFFVSFKKRTLNNFIKSSVVVILAVILSLSANIQRLWSTYEYGQETMRGKSELVDESGNQTSGLDKNYMLSYSYDKMETFNLIIPDFKGGGPLQDNGETKTFNELKRRYGVSDKQASQISSMLMYWGEQPIVSGAIYVGAVMFFLFTLAFFILKTHYRWWALATVILAIMLAWGKHFMPLTDFFIDYVPGYDKFRDVKNILVVVQFLVPFLGLLALKEFFNDNIKIEVKKEALKKAFYISGGLMLFFILFGALFSFTGLNDINNLNRIGIPAEGSEAVLTSLLEDRLNLLRTDAFRSLLFIMLGASILWAYLLNKLKLNYAIIALIIIVIIDMWGVDKRYLKDSDFEDKKTVNNPFPASNANKQILDNNLASFSFGDTEHYRVYNLTTRLDQDASTAYYHKTIGGYHGAKLKRYQELIDAYLFKGYQNNSEVFDMLNAKYFIVPVSQDPKIQPVAQLNTRALGNAWFVKSHKIVSDADAELNAISSLSPHNFDASEFAVIDQRFKGLISNYQFDSTATIILNEYYPNKLVYSYTSRTPQFTVFSEVFYNKGWNAYIDNKLASYFRVNYILRGMIVPEGSHKLEFKFEPASHFFGQKIAYASSILILLLFLGVVFFEVRKKEEIA